MYLAIALYNFSQFLYNPITAKSQKPIMVPQKPPNNILTPNHHHEELISKQKHYLHILHNNDTRPNLMNYESKKIIIGEQRKREMSISGNVSV